MKGGLSQYQWLPACAAATSLHRLKAIHAVKQQRSIQLKFQQQRHSARVGLRSRIFLLVYLLSGLPAVQLVKKKRLI